MLLRCLITHAYQWGRDQQRDSMVSLGFTYPESSVVFSRIFSRNVPQLSLECSGNIPGVFRMCGVTQFSEKQEPLTLREGGVTVEHSRSANSAFFPSALFVFVCFVCLGVMPCRTLPCHTVPAEWGRRLERNVREHRDRNRNRVLFFGGDVYVGSRQVRNYSIRSSVKHDADAVESRHANVSYKIV